MVCATTPVESPRWASSWLMPAWGRRAVPIRNPSVAHASTAWCTVGVVGQRRRPRPEERLGRADGRVDVPEVDAVDDAHVAAGVHEPARAGGRGVVGRRGPAASPTSWRTTSGSSASSSTRKRGQAVALPRGHGVAGERAPVVHRVDRQLRAARRCDRGAAKTAWMERTSLPGWRSDGDHDGLGQELATEDDVALTGVAGVRHRVAVLARRSGRSAAGMSGSSA